MSPVTHSQSPLALTFTPLAGPQHCIGVGTLQSTWHPTASARIWQAVLPDLVMTYVDPDWEGSAIAVVGGFCGFGEGGCTDGGAGGGAAFVEAPVPRVESGGREDFGAAVEPSEEVDSLVRGHRAIAAMTTRPMTAAPHRTSMRDF